MKGWLEPGGGRGAHLLDCIESLGHAMDVKAKKSPSMMSVVPRTVFLDLLAILAGSLHLVEGSLEGSGMALFKRRKMDTKV